MTREEAERLALQTPGAMAAPVVREGERLFIAPPVAGLSWELIQGPPPNELREGDWVVLRPLPLTTPSGGEHGDGPGAGPPGPFPPLRRRRGLRLD